jgi:hypothetical protein
VICEVCRQYLSKCTCPLCPVCGKAANTECQDQHTYRTSKAALKALLEQFGGKKLALSRYLGINNTHVYRATNGEGFVGPLLENRLRELGLIRQQKVRFRLAADFDSEEEREQFIEQQLEGLSFTDWVKEKGDVS